MEGRSDGVRSLQVGYVKIDRPKPVTANPDGGALLRDGSVKVSMTLKEDTEVRWPERSAVDSMRNRRT